MGKKVFVDLSHPFFGDMPQKISQAHLVVARAGASSVTEIAVIGRPTPDNENSRRYTSRFVASPEAKIDPSSL